MKLEEWVWDTFKRLEDTKVIKLDSYEIIEDPSYRQYFDMVNTLPWATLADDDKTVNVDSEKIEYDEDEFENVNEYILWELKKLVKKADSMAKAHPRLMKCNMTIEVNGQTKQVTRLLALPRTTSWDRMYDVKSVKPNW
jgi:hypothetical protein